MLIPFANDDGSPNEAAAYAVAICLSALYHGQPAAIRLYGTYTGTELVDFESDRLTVRPDRAVLRGATEALVMLIGTTNSAQWVGHCGSAIFPEIDPMTPLRRVGSPLCNGTFYAGLFEIERQLYRDINPIGLGPVQVAGHSYGAGAAHIFARHLANAVGRPSTVSLMTMGQPKTYDAFVAVSEPDYYARIIASLENPTASEALDVDPVVNFPPGLLLLGKVGTVVKWLRNVLGFSWAHHGTPWVLAEDGRYRRGVELPLYLQLTPGVSLPLLAGSLVDAHLHFMDQSYLVKCWIAWKRSGKHPGLSVFDEWYSAFTGTPFIPANILGPPVSAATLNRAWIDGASPITDPDRPQWENFAAVGHFSSSGEGSATMSRMKGELLLNIMEQGCSEGFHSSLLTTTYTQMRDKLADIVVKRFLLSNGAKTVDDDNKLFLVAFRISDDLLIRDTFDIPQATPSTGWGGNVQNNDGNLCCKVVWRDEANQQIAATYLHGVPTNACRGQLGTESTRQVIWDGTYISRLNAYCTAIKNADLGFNTLNRSPANAMGAIAPNGVVYDATSGCYTFTMALPVPQGEFRVRMARFKSLRGVNGRWTAVATGANSFRLQKPLPLHTWDGFGTAVPLSGYNAGVAFSNYIVVKPASCQPTLLCSRKLGRPFFLQHGRASRRAS